MKTGTTIQRRTAVISMALALVIASLVSEASALPPIAATLQPQVPLAKPPCSEQKKREIRARATPGEPGVLIDCSLTLEPDDVITKRLHFRGNESDGVIVNCNDATIDGGSSNEVNYDEDAPEDMVEIYSARFEDSPGVFRWERPENITVRNCNIIGSVAVWGMEKWGDAGIYLRSSRLPGHVERVRNAAPRNIVFDDVVITGVGTRAPLYLHFGVGNFQLLNSEINGTSGDDVNVYLDAESHQNTFRNNSIHAKTSKREVMAVDGSSHNVIVGNYFSSLDDGGIFLYRNCGEDIDDIEGTGDGMIRHSTPSGNQIINNVFYYDAYRGSNPAVFVGERNGDRKYCGEDAGYPFGSSASDLDHAQHNVVMQNQILKRSVGDMIKVGRRDTDTPNYIDHNEGNLGSAQSRPSGCYVATGYKNFIQHGQFIDLFKTPDGQPVCRGSETRGDRGPAAVTSYLRYNCTDGVLSAASNSSCQVSHVPFECQATDSNEGCTATAFCPAGKRIIGGRLACNLEFGTVSSTDLNGAPLDSFGGPMTDFMKVVRESDRVADGSCTLGGVSIKRGAADIRRVSFGPLTGAFFGASSTSFGCRESDKNGGDCHVKGTLYCR